MTSDLSDQLGSLQLNNDRISMPTNSTSRRYYGSNENTRSKLRSNRAATIDHGSHEEKLRIVVLGATKVGMFCRHLIFIIELRQYSLSFLGKTCLCQQFLQQKFLTDHKETVDELFSIELALVDRHITLEILDTAGIDEFPVMRRLAIARGDAFLIVYAVNDASSFDMARQLRELVYEIKSDLVTGPIPMVIVGNKCDIATNLREITREYAESIVRDQWESNLIETTCHERESVFNAFHLLLQMANINLTLNADVTRRSSDPNLSAHKEHRSTSKRPSCAQQ